MGLLWWFVLAPKLYCDVDGQGQRWIFA